MDDPNRQPLPMDGKKGGLTRRQLLGGAITGAIGLAAARLFTLDDFIASAQASAPDDDLVERFMSLSAKLIPQYNLDPAIGRRLLDALNQHFEDTPESLAYLAQVIDQPQSQWDDAQRNAAKRVLYGWYTGIVGEGEKAVVVIYEDALQFRCVENELIVRSYCPNKPGFWAEKPTARSA